MRSRARQIDGGADVQDTGPARPARRRHRAALAAALVLTCAGRAGVGFEIYLNQGSFFRDSGADEPTYTFDELASEQCVDARFGCTRLPGVTFRSDSVVQDEWVVAAHDISETRSPPRALRAGPRFDPVARQYRIRIDFDRPPTAVGLWVSSLAAGDSCTGEEFVLIDVTTVNGNVRRSGRNPTFGRQQPNFWGVISAEPIARVDVRSGYVCADCKFGGPAGPAKEGAGCYYEYYPRWGLDDLTFVPGPIPPPLCSRDIEAETRDGVVAGRAAVDADATGGLVEVRLETGARNLVLDVDPAFEPGAGEATFDVRRESDAVDGTGTLVALDAAGGTCRMDVAIHDDEGGRRASVVLHRDGRRRLEALVPRAGLDGITSSVASLSALGAADLPPGYVKLEPDYDLPACDLLAITGAPAAEALAYTTDGRVDPRLRLLAAYSTDGGASFPSLADVTEALTVDLRTRPHRTRLVGTAGAGPLRLACALLVGADCSDPAIDGVDADGDGSPLCAGGIAVDCGDQSDRIHPGADERCNGLDDDCDGEIDEGCG